MVRINEVPFVKGHGTGNDFIIIPDIDAKKDLTAEQVRHLCDRHRGIGGNGVLRVVRTEHMRGYESQAAEAEFFMDYRNADGSLAEMCGNGARVFARYLDAVGLVTKNDFVIGTRGGSVAVTLHTDHTVSLVMGKANSPQVTSMPQVTVGSQSWKAVPVWIPNPHAVTFLDSLADAGSLVDMPHVAPDSTFPEGVNVEFVVVHGPRHVAMRVYERGVGETLACGTGACAVAWASRRHLEPDLVGESSYTVDMPGGSVTVTEDSDGLLRLTGPADLVARGTVLLA
jgi:diaminopimelate epimerase